MTNEEQKRLNLGPSGNDEETDEIDPVKERRFRLVFFARERILGILSLMSQKHAAVVGLVFKEPIPPDAIVHHIWFEHDRDQWGLILAHPEFLPVSSACRPPEFTADYSVCIEIAKLKEVEDDGC